MAALKLILPLLLLVLTSPAAGRDWFVKAGSSGDGSKGSPFGDPWEALEKCEAGDAIHVAEGRYTGKLQTGQWTIPFDGVKLLGGYNADFTKRDPWTHHAKLVYDRNSKNFPKDARIWVKTKDVVVDGFVVDVAEQNQYDADPPGRAPRSLDSGEAALRSVVGVTVRNCVFLNTGREAIVTGAGAVIENNLFMNTFDAAVKVNGTATAPLSTVKNNTFVWSWCDRAPGKGRYSGAGVSLGAPCAVTANIFAHMDNNAVYSTIKTEKTSVTRNVFWMNLWSNVKVFVDGQDVAIDDKSMELLEEAGFKAIDDNEVANPELPLDATWMDGTAKRSAGTGGKVTMDDWNKYRQLMGLPLIATGGAPPSGVAPLYPLEKAIALLTPRKAGLKAGARIVPLEAKFADAAAAGTSKSYEKAELTSWAKSPASVNGKALEMVVAISNVANVSGIPDPPYKKDEHEGIWIHDGMGQERVVGFYKKGSNANRVANEGAGRYNGSGKADRLYVVKGTAVELKGFPKAGFFIESIAPFEMSLAERKRAVGRDWFVRAGALGGNGSKEKPFRDPFQALEKCEAGDFIHVAGGEYVGKLKAGHWKIDMPDLTILGGYDKDFASRDPWKNPSLLHTPADFKGSRNSYTVEGVDDHSGVILDGFAFDKKLNNLYQSNGDLMYSQSEKMPHVWLSKPGVVIRNCVFVNGSEGAVRVHGGQTLENNIFFNHYLRAVKVETGLVPEAPFVFRNNTVAFAWEPKFGEGKRQGDLLVLGAQVRSIIDNNVFEFADNHAIRMDTPAKDVELTNNVFAHNLYAEVYRTTDVLFIDNKTFGQLRELGFKKLENNQLLTAALPVEQKWFDVYLSRTAMTPGKVAMDDWNKLRELIGQPVIATGGKAGTGVAPAYDWKKALELFPKNPACKAGARPAALSVAFTGVARAEAEHEYAETSWDVAKAQAEWDKLDGKRVQLKVAISRLDNQYSLPEARKEEWNAFMVGGPLGSDSGGLPMRVYVQRGTRHERAVLKAKGYASGKPEETHLIKGVAKAGRGMLVEAVERAD